MIVFNCLILKILMIDKQGSNQIKMVHILFVSVGRPKHVRVMAGALEGDTFIGPIAEVM